MTRHTAFVGVETERECPPYGELLAVHVIREGVSHAGSHDVSFACGGDVAGAYLLSVLLDDATVVSVNASADMLQFRKLLAGYRTEPALNGRIHDAIDAASALIRAQANTGILPRDGMVDLRSDREVSRALGVAPPRHQDQHTAVARAVWARCLWAAVKNNDELQEQRRTEGQNR